MCFYIACERIGSNYDDRALGAMSLVTTSLLGVDT